MIIYAVMQVWRKRYFMLKGRELVYDKGVSNFFKGALRQYAYELVEEFCILIHTVQSVYLP